MIADALPGSLVASLSGPTFAGEVAEGKPAAMTLGCESDDPIVGEIQLAFERAQYAYLFESRFTGS